MNVSPLSTLYPIFFCTSKPSTKLQSHAAPVTSGVLHGGEDSVCEGGLKYVSSMKRNIV